MNIDAILPDERRPNVAWQGLAGAATALYLARAGSTWPAPLLLVARDAAQAARLEEEVRFFARSGLPILAFPGYETLPYDQFSPHPDIISQRLRTTKLGNAHLQNNDPSAALRATTKASNMHRAQSFALPDGFTSQEIWWRHTQALLANKKTKEAQESLERSYDFLIERIVSLRDIGLRRNYLNKVAVNRELIQFWVKDGMKRKLPNEKLFAHLSIESNLREPFKRLADTGLRLNALKSVSEIQTFLVEEATELSGGERVMLILEKDGKPEVADALLPRGEDTSTVLRECPG